jgi:hypothetical protein
MRHVNVRFDFLTVVYSRQECGGVGASCSPDVSGERHGHGAQDSPLT